jgi:cell wall-associated NlpC family hydrolase
MPRRPLLASLVLAALAAGSAGCASAGGTPRPRPFPAPGAPEAGATPGSGAPTSAPAAPPTVASPSAQALVLALGFLGTSYTNGGATPRGFDCSGLVQYVFGQVGVRLPRTVRDQFAATSATREEVISPGDLVFFRTTSRGPSHVGIATSATEFVHAPNERSQVRTDSMLDDYWRRRFLGARRIAADAPQPF